MMTYPMELEFSLILWVINTWDPSLTAKKQGMVPLTSSKAELS